MNRKKLYKIIVSNLKKQGAKKIVLFGSYARNEQTEDSDIDLIVDFIKTKSLLEIVKIEKELSKTTGKKIELLTEDSISPHIKNSIKKEREVLLA